MGAAQSRELKRSDKVRSKFPNTEVTCKPVTDEDLCFISRLRSWKGNVVEQLMLCPFSPMHCTVDDPLLQLLYSFTLTDPFYPCFDVSCTMPAIERFPTLLVFHDYLKTMYKRNDENPESNINGPNCCSPDAHNIVRSWVLLRIADNVVEQTVASMNNSSNNNNSSNSSGLASSPFAPTPNSGHVSTIKYGFLKCLLTNSNVKPKISVGGYYHSLSTLTELPQGTFADSLGGEAACCGVGTPCTDVVAGSQQEEQGGGGSPASSPVAPREVGVDPQAQTTNSASPAPSSGGSGSAPSSNHQINAVEVGLLQQKYRCDVDITFCLARTFCNEARSATLFHCVTYAERASAKTATKDQVVYPTKVNLRFRKGNLPALRLFAKLYQWHLTTPEGKPAAEVGQNFNIASCDTCQSCNAADPSTKGEDELLCIVVNGPVLTGMLQSAATVCRKGPNGSYTIASFIAQQILPRHSAQQVLGGAGGGSAPASPGHPLVDGGRESPLASGQRANSETITSEGEIGTPSPSGSNAGGGAGLSSTTGGGGLAKSLNLNSSGTASVSGGGKQTLKQNQVVNMEASSCPTPFDALIKLAKVSWSVEDANLGASQSLGGGGSSSMAGLAGLGSSRVQAQLGMIGPPLASPTIVEPYSAVNFLNVSGTNSPTHGSRHGSRQGSRQASRQGSRAGSRQASGQNSPMASHLQYTNNSGSPTGDSTTYLGLPTVSGARRESQGYGSGPASGNSEGTGYAILSPPPDQMRGGSGVLGDPYNNSGNSGGHGSGGGMLSKLSPGGSAMHSANASGLGTPVHSATNVPLMPPTSEGGSSPHQDPYSPNVVPRVKGGGGGMSRGSSFQRGAGGSNSQQGGDSLAGSLKDHSNPLSPHNNQQRQQQPHNNPHIPHPHHQQQQQQNPASLNNNNIPHQQQWNNQQGLGGGGTTTASYNPPPQQQQQQQQTQMMMPQQYPGNNQPHQQFNGNNSNQFQQQRGNSLYNFNNGNNSRQQYHNGAPQQQQQTGGVMPPPPFHQAPPPHQQPPPPHSPQQNFPITIPDNTPVHASAGANGSQPQWMPCWWVDQSQRIGGPRVYLQRCAYQPHLADGRVLLELHMDFKSNRQFVPHLPLVDANGQLVTIGGGGAAGGGNAGQYASTVIAVPVGTNAYQGPSSALAPIM